MTFEERIKAVLGDLQFALIAQAQQSDELRARLEKAEARIQKDADAAKPEKAPEAPAQDAPAIQQPEGGEAP